MTHDHPPEARPRVLLAEDDAAMRALMAEALEDAGFDVQAVEDGQAALPWQGFDPKLDSFEFDADVVITDYRMPRVDGLELLAAVRRGRRHVPVVLVSAFADARLLQLAATLGAAVVLAKPFSLEALVSAVRAAHASQARLGE